MRSYKVKSRHQIQEAQPNPLLDPPARRMSLQQAREVVALNKKLKKAKSPPKKSTLARIANFNPLTPFIYMNKGTFWLSNKIRTTNWAGGKLR